MFVILRLSQFVELFKLKFRLYLRITQTSVQAANGLVECDTYPIIYFDIYFVYAGISALLALRR